MKQKTTTKSFMLQVVTAMAVLLGHASWAKGNLELKNEAFQEIEEIAADGTKTKKLVPAAKIVPGNDVVYVITYKNISNEPATNVIVKNAIPKHLIYRSAESDAIAPAEVSVDGGKKFGNLSDLKVTDKLRKVRPALPSDVTHVRWKVAGAVAPKQEGKVRFRAMLE